MIQEGVEYILRLKDYLSGAMPKVVSTTQSAFAKVDASAAKAQKKVDAVGKAADTATSKLGKLAAPVRVNLDGAKIVTATREAEKLNATLQKVAKTSSRVVVPTPGAGGGGRGSVSGALGLGALTRFAAGLGIVTALTGATVNATNSGLQAGAQQMSFQTIAGQQAGGVLYKDLTKYAQESIYGSEVYKNAQTQLAFGNDAKQVMPTVRMLGDVAMGDKQRNESLNLAYSQVLAAGKLQGQDLLQFVNAGFNPLQEMSVKTGKSMAQLKTDMSDGKITFDMVRQSFMSATSEGGKFYKMTERLNSTDYGRMQNFKGSLEGLAREAGAVIAPRLGKFLDDYGRPFIDWVGNTVIPKLGGVLDGVSDYMPMIAELAQSGYQMVKPVLGFLGSDDFKDLAHEFGDLALSLQKDLIPAVELAAQGLGVVAKILKPIVGLGTTTTKSIHGDLNLAGAADGAQRLFAEQRVAKAKAFSFMSAGLITGKIPYADLNTMFDPRIQKPAAGVPFPSLVNKNLVPPATAGGKNTVADFFGSTGSGTGNDAITGGGKKTTIINFNKELVAPGGIVQNIAGGPQMGAHEIRRIVVQELDEIANSVGGAGN